jgi:CDP-6-deoxy-D-xylo-4-hexulose-3-dehydrase
MKRWFLNTNHTTLWDRLKLCQFFLSPKNRWTQDKYVKLIEEKMSEFIGVKYSIFVSSGSTANTILAMYLKDHVNIAQRNKVIFPANTWITSVSPFIREGFSPEFLDITLKDLSMDLDKLEEYLSIDSLNNNIAAVFITSLLGISPDIVRIKKLINKYPNIKFWLDNCEATFSLANTKNISGCGITSTTSTYFGHQLQSVEGGFIFTDSEDIYEYALMARNHGMTRSVSNPIYQNKKVDKLFDFYLLGNNFRNTDINAFIGLLYLDKINYHISKRCSLYKEFCNFVSQYEYYTFLGNVMFCIPIIAKDSKKYLINDARQFCLENKIETRPIIAGNLLRQTCLKKYANFLDYPVSEYIHHYGFYVGLYPGLTYENVRQLAINI